VDEDVVPIPQTKQTRGTLCVMQNSNNMINTNLIEQIDSLKSRFLEMDNLHTKLDSIQNSQILNEINFKLNETANIINNVNAFYESAWLKLIVVITIIGIVVPIVIQYFQRKSNKDIFEKYSSDFELKLNERINILEERNKKYIAELQENYNKEIDKLKQITEEQTDTNEANTFYLQGRLRFSEKNYKHALPDFIYSTEKYLKVGNIERMLVLLSFINNCIIKIEKKSVFDEVLLERKTDWDEFIAKCYNNKNREEIKNNIAEIIKEVNKLR